MQQEVSLYRHSASLSRTTTPWAQSVQAQILHLMKQMRAKLGAAVLLITHDLGVIAEMCDRLAIMYAGHVVEEGNVFSIFERPLHPYTNGILSCIPSIDRPVDKLMTIAGTVPSLAEPLPGCSFESRCTERLTMCSESSPPEIYVDADHRVRCFLYGKDRSWA